MKTKILNLTTELPPNKYNQEEIFQLISPFFKDNPKAESIFMNSAISTRYSALDDLAGFYFDKKRSTKDRNEVYQKAAFDLCTKAISRCLEESGVSAREIDDLIIVSCTGVNIPGLDIFLAKKFEMKPELQRTGILFMGCYAAFPALRKAIEFTSFRPGSKALVVCVELCSLHFQYNDSIENIVSSSLFADGCAVALIEANDDNSNNLPVLVDSQVHTQYDTTEHMAFILTDEGFQMNLSAYVPGILKVNAESFVEKLLTRNNLKKEDIKFWLIHPGGIKILSYLQESLGLTEEHVKYSKAVLDKYGNMSSPTVLFVLKELLDSGDYQKGDKAVMMAFGPGLTMEAVLLRWD